MRLDNLSAKESFKAEAMSARGLGDIIKIKYFDVVEKEVEDLQEKEGEVAVVTNTVPELQEFTRSYYIGSAKLVTLGSIVSIVAVAYARGANVKRILDLKHNIPIVEELTKAGVLADFVGAMLGEDDTEWVEATVTFTDAVDVIAAFLKHNDFFGLLDKVMGTVQNLQMPKGMSLTPETARNALLGGLAQNG